MPAASNTPPPILWIVGDSLLAEEQWRLLVGSQDVVRLDGKKLDIAALSSEIDTMPMFLDHKWILVQDFRLPEKRAAAEAKATPSKRAKAGGEKAKKALDPDQQLLAAVGRIGPACTVIFVSPEGDKRSRLYKLVEERGQYVELASFREYETAKIADWVAARLLACGKKIPPPLAAEFAECVGPDVGLLVSEVTKLTVCMGDETTVRDEHMEVLAGSPIALRKLMDEGVARKQPARAQAILCQILDSNEAPLRILNFMAPRVRDWLKARLFPEGRNDPQKAAALFGNMHPFRLKILYEEANRFKPTELRDAMHSLVLADTCLKSSVDAAHVLGLLVAALSGGIDHASFARAVGSYVEPWD